MYRLTRSDFFKVTSKLKMANTWLNHRLQFLLKNNLQLQRAVQENRALYGGLDTWLLSKLKNTSSELDHISDITYSAATGIFDVFKLEFSTPMLSYFGINRKILPRVVSNFHDFGYTDKNILGAPVRIDVVISDQSASLIANRCFEAWSSKITLGTGSFFHVNVGDKCIGSDTTGNPLVAWWFPKRSNKPTFKLEFFHESSSESIKFMETVGLISDVKELANMASSVENSDGVLFVPEFFGFIGIKQVFKFGNNKNFKSIYINLCPSLQTTNRLHLVRAVLENIIFNICTYIFATLNEPNYRPNKIRIDGGISMNDFVCQQIATLSGINIERARNSSELTSVGCTILCAYKCGLLESLEESENFYESDKIFIPEASASASLRKDYERFLRVVKKL